MGTMKLKEVRHLNGDVTLTAMGDWVEHNYGMDIADKVKINDGVRVLDRRGAMDILLPPPIEN
jgi:hypothetical protein